MSIPVCGERVRLRDFEEKDLQLYWRWMQPGNAWQRTDGPYYPPETPQELEAGFAKIKKRVTEKNFPSPRMFLAIADKDTDVLVGRVSSYWECVDTKWLCAGIDIYDQGKWGKGLGYEAMRLWVDYLFGARPDIVRLELRTWSGNRGMVRLAEKLGFRREACFRKARIVDGNYYDALGFGILREEWIYTVSPNQ